MFSSATTNAISVADLDVLETSGGTLKVTLSVTNGTLSLGRHDRSDVHRRRRHGRPDDDLQRHAERDQHRPRRPVVQPTVTTSPSTARPTLRWRADTRHGQPITPPGRDRRLGHDGRGHLDHGRPDRPGRIPRPPTPTSYRSSPARATARSRRSPRHRFTYTPDANYNGPDSFTYKRHRPRRPRQLRALVAQCTPP